MSIARLIAPEVPTLKPTDTGDQALVIMEENNYTQLPVVNDDNYIGLAKEHELLDWDSTDNQLDTSPYLAYKPAILINSHPYDALTLANKLNLAVLPVVDSENKYLGAVTRDSLLKYLTETSGIDNPGGIIVLEMEPRNYSLYLIARICENEDVLIINAQMFTTPMGTMEVTLKTNRTNLDAVVSSFERHEYTVKAVYGDVRHAEDLMSKYELLMNYLNM